MVEAPAQGAAVGSLYTAQLLAAARPHVLEQHAAQRGHHGERHQQRRHQHVGQGQGKGHQQLAHRAAGEDHGQEDAHGGEGGGHHRAAHLAGALGRRAGGLVAALAQAVDVLHHHDAVVHQHADGDGHGTQGHDVEVEPGEVHHHQREEHAEGDGEGHDDSGLGVAQEERQHDDGQQRTQQQGLEHCPDVEVDVVALVHDLDDVEALVVRLEAGELLVDDLRDVAHVGGGALGERQHDAGLPVEVGVALAHVAGDHDVCHVAHGHVAHAVDLGEHQALELLGAGEALAHLDEPLLVACALDVASGHLEVLGGDQLRQRAHVEQLVDVGGLAGGVAVLLVGPAALRELLLAGLQLGAGGGDRGQALLDGAAALVELALLLHQGEHGRRRAAHVARLLLDGLEGLLHDRDLLLEAGGLGAVALGLGHLQLNLQQPQLGLVGALHRVDGVHLRQARVGLLLGGVKCLLAGLDLLERAVELLFGGVELHQARADLVGALVDLVLGLRELLVGLAQDAVVDEVDLVLVELDGDGVLDAACHVHARHAVLALERGHDDIFGKLGELGQAELAVREAQVHGRHHVHAHLHVAGRARRVWQLARRRVARGRDLHQR